MTENEAIENFNEWLDRASEFRKTQSNDYKPDHVLAMELAVKALEEVQQYREIGTVEQFERAKAMENVYGQVKWERDVAISQLEEIGVGLGQKMEELKALKEKNEPKKPIITSKVEDCEYMRCTNCNLTTVLYGGMRPVYCANCGQKLDWSE